ncbi:MAG: hypothetical protein JWL75_630 [Parcubacteria group bacterium]|nr:hypothetical protein [Parcubacteria group bacterium]
MKTLNRLTTAAIGASLVFTPMLALADTNVDAQANTSVRGGFLSGIFHSNEDKGVKADVNASMHSSSSAEKDNKENNGNHLGQMKNGANGEVRADNSIDARVGALSKLSARLNDAKQLTAEEKTSFMAMIQTQIDALNALKAKIGNDISTSTMRDDAGHIRTEFRTYALVLPRAAITAASDRILNIAANMDTVGAKLNTRIDAAASSSVNVTAARASYTDYLAKVADAKVQAKAAASLVVNLSADNGNATVYATNTAALKAAAAKLVIARADLKAARKDMSDILKAVKGTGATATTTAQTSH